MNALRRALAARNVLAGHPLRSMVALLLTAERLGVAGEDLHDRDATYDSLPASLVDVEGCPLNPLIDSRRLR